MTSFTSAQASTSASALARRITSTSTLPLTSLEEPSVRTSSASRSAQDMMACSSRFIHAFTLAVVASSRRFSSSQLMPGGA